MEGELEVVGLCATWRNCVEDVHMWYRLAKEEFRQKRYVKEFGSKGDVRLYLG